MNNQPNYHESMEKYMARELCPRLYKLFTKKNKIPKNKQYLTLANIQVNSPTSEINQMINSNLISANQFVGIDNNKNYIDQNTQDHPEALFFHGDWNLLLSKRCFNPAIIYLDSTHFGNRLPAVKTLKSTLDICDYGTLVICNVMETNPRSGFWGEYLDTQCLIENLLYKEIPAKYKDWNLDSNLKSWEEIENSSIYIPAFNYQTSKTLMKSYVFFKGAIPSEEVMTNFFEEFTVWCNKFEKSCNEKKGIAC